MPNRREQLLTAANLLKEGLTRSLEDLKAQRLKFTGFKDAKKSFIELREKNRQAREVKHDA